MDAVLISAPRHTPTPVANAKPVDVALNVAVRHMAMRTNRTGWHEVVKFEDAPTTLQAVTDYYSEHGVLCVATEDSEGTIYDCADTNVHLRAWHDTLHVRWQLQFNTAGEAAATYCMVAQLYEVYGINEKTKRWASFILADILGLVLHYQRVRKFPKNKRAGTINEQKRWTLIADEIAYAMEAVRSLEGVPYEHMALALSAKTWGGYA